MLNEGYIYFGLRGTLGFSNHLLAFLVEVNASIDIDTYILPNENDEELDATTFSKRSDAPMEEPEWK